MHETFISYSRKDIEFVERLNFALEKRGIDPWFDREDIAPAAPWRKEMLLGVQYCCNYLFVVSPASLESLYCKEELDCALRHNKRLIPILYQPPTSSLYPVLGELNWIFFNDFDRGIDSVVRAIQAPVGQNLSDRIPAEIEVVVGQSSRTIPLYRSLYWIGREPKPDSQIAGAIVVRDKNRIVSRCHMELKAELQGWRPIDRSRNGLRCLPALTPEGLLRHGTRIFLSSLAYLLYREIDSDAEREIDDNPTVGAEE
jgi:hypothetical protein